MKVSFGLSPARSLCGVSLIEVLVTVVILAIGLLGLAGLQIRLQSSELESYQRTHALILLEDMANRLSANRANAATYVTASANPLGTGDSQPVSCAGNGQSFDACQWSNALKGASEQSSLSVNVGAMIGARGCIEDLGTGDQFMITVAWQGMTPISAPSSNCGTGLYDGAPNTKCTDDLCRRTMSTIIRVANLASP
ncbi:type IV pilus modification protein PilV [Nitrosomonas sp. Nm166]|uniref:type IV pilus modification protein PilV n=1 Tax=Nitrosomonas sp. Nm166 TaxID=1881054 RepID=UPI000A485CB6|nr:type IV pilus modification protein PilV [Nitrosomonas sp. Nm166]